jgi:FMN phosphatase YigB (HAD superfamily)
MSFDAVATHKAIIFDWDDTICPSSFVDRYKIERMEKLPRNVSCQSIAHALRAGLEWPGCTSLIRKLRVIQLESAILARARTKSIAVQQRCV